MKCISLRQPWATLVAIGAKEIETRSWPTFHRGALLIHASAKVTREAIELRHEEPFKSMLAAAGFKIWQDLPLGAVIAKVELIECRQMLWDAAVVNPQVAPMRSPPPLPELAFGDYQGGRYAWLLAKPVMLPAPVPYKGRERLFDVAPQEVGFE